MFFSGSSGSTGSFWIKGYKGPLSGLLLLTIFGTLCAFCSSVTVRVGLIVGDHNCHDDKALQLRFLLLCYLDCVPCVNVNANANANANASLLMKKMLAHGLFTKRKCFAGVEIYYYYSIAVKFY